MSLSEKVSVAIIGGTGVYDPGLLQGTEKVTVNTPWGEVTVDTGYYQGKRLAFLARHGAGHTVPPHLVNYRANIWALKMLGVKSIFATAAVGSLNQALAPAHFVLVDQFLDFTKSRPQTFVEQGVVHIDMTEPYCPELRHRLAGVAEEMGLICHKSGVYVCTEGPRFETPAEIRMFRQLGGDVVGMTSVPEVVLAREAGICYATVAMVTNYAAGISPQRLTHQEVVEMMSANIEKIRRLLLKAAVSLPAERQCSCHEVPEEVAVLIERTPAFRQDNPDRQAKEGMG